MPLLRFRAIRDVVIALHVIAVILAFGLPLAYPMLLPYLRRHHPRAMPGVHDVQHRLNQRLTGPGTVLIFAFGAYLATKRGYWDEPWVLVPLGILLFIAVVGGGYVVPVTARLANLARADVESAPVGGEITWGHDYDRHYSRYMAVEVLLGLLVLTAIFFMTTRPFS